MKVLNLKESLSTYDGIGDFKELKERLEMLEKMLEDYISQNRRRNLDVKTTLIEEAKSYASNPDWREATEKLKELRQRWIRVGAVEEDKKEEIENTFQAVYDEFYEKKKAFHEAKKEMMATREKQYEALIEKGIEVDRHAILLEEPIKALGIYDIPVKITKGLNQEVKVYVIQA